MMKNGNNRATKEEVRKGKDQKKEKMREVGGGIRTDEEMKEREKEEEKLRGRKEDE